MPDALTVTRPVKAWNKPLKADFKSLFKALSKTAVHGATGEWTKASTHFSDALTAIGLEDKPEQLGWVLIFRALSRAMFDLVEESSPHFYPGDHDFDALADDLDLSLESTDVTIDSSFFDRPKELPLIAEMAEPFRTWLIGAGLEEAAAQSVSDRLGTYFVFRLGDEWTRESKTFTPLRDAFDSPFAKAEETERAWMRYSAWLQRQVDEPLFDEAFGLRQIYIPLRAYWEEKPRDVRHYDPSDPARWVTKVKRTTIQLEDGIEAWVKKADRKDAIRVISGGPGSGKSSAAKMLAARLAADVDRRILFVPLHHFEPGTDLADALEDFAKEDPYLPEKPLDPKAHGERLLIFFDGLDELAMQGKIAQEVSQKFVREVIRTLDRLNREDCRLQVILGGRELVIQSNRDEFRRHQLLYLFGYLVPKKEHGNYQDTDEILDRDDRNIWWKRYGRLSGKGYANLPKALSGDRLAEVTSQPLLNYLFALSYDRGKVEFTESTSLNMVYRDLLAAVWERGYEGRTHRAIQGVSEKQFLRILEEIALAAWHGDGRTTTVHEIEEHCSGTGLKEILDKFQEGAESGVTRLLTAFYFRQKDHRRSGDKTFEFTHKSFGEYLTARRIVGKLQTICRQRKRRQEDPDDGWNERQALKSWAEVCGPTAMEGYLFAFLQDEVALQGKAVCREWQILIQNLWSFLLRHGMPIVHIQTPLLFRDLLLYARNAEEALVVTLSATSSVTHINSTVDWPDRHSFGGWWQRIREHSTSTPLVASHLARLNLQDQNLQGLFLANTNFEDSNLRGADLTYANFVGSRLMGVNLSGATLDRTNLTGAEICRAYLKDADLTSAFFKHAEVFFLDLGEGLAGANLTGANLKDVDLGMLELKDVHMDGAFLFGADLSKTRSLTQAQVDVAKGNEQTTLPPSIKRPNHWTKKSN